MQNVSEKQGAGDAREASFSSSCSSGVGTHEDPASWGDRPPPIPSKPAAVQAAMASAQNGSNRSSLVPVTDSKRISDATVFEEELVGAGERRKPPQVGTASLPLGDKRRSSVPDPPPDMEDIE